MKVYTGSRVVTGRPDEVIERAGVGIEGDRIAWVGPVSDMPPDVQHAETVDLGDATILPGLIDAHVHLGFDGGPDPVSRMKGSTDAQLLILMLRSARELLNSGVTTARELGARGFLDLDVKRAIEAGDAEGPRLVCSTRPLTSTGGHCWFMGCECDSVDDVRRMVRLHHREGADLIKVMATGGFMTAGSAPWFPQFSLEQMRVIVEEAHRLGKKVSAHCHGTEGIRNAVEVGVDTIEHCSWVGEGMSRVYDPDVAEKIVEKGIYVCPTLNCRAMTFRPDMWEERAETLATMREMGMLLIAGTDAGINLTPHTEFVGGLEAHVATGMNPIEVIHIATSRAADALGIGNLTGTLEIGKEADVIAAGGDPLTTIGDLRELRLILTRGREHAIRFPSGVSAGVAG